MSVNVVVAKGISMHCRAQNPGIITLLSTTPHPHCARACIPYLDTAQLSHLYNIDAYYLHTYIYIYAYTYLGIHMLIDVHRHVCAYNYSMGSARPLCSTMSELMPTLLVVFPVPPHGIEGMPARD